MRQLIYAVIAILAGYGLTLVFYVIGDPFVRPALALARLLNGDRGGDSLLPTFLVINTMVCSLLVYVGLRCVIKMLRH
jgi:hypothetical protein